MEISEISINYKPLLQPSEIKKVVTSLDAATFFRSIWSEKLEYIEEFKVLMLTRANKIIGFVKISQGGTTGTVVDPKLIFQAALKANANSLILAHNHPSGQLKPSEQDLFLTKKIKDAGKFLEIPVLDHIILTGESYFSFADDGLL